MELRLEEESDYRVVENLTREAFWDVYKPGCDEHYIAHNLRKASAFIPQLDYVVTEDNKIIGNIMYTKEYVLNESGDKHEVITFGPISVLPEYQGRKVGTLMIEHTKKLAADMGFKAIIIFGNPNYYHRFGFVSAQKYNITTAEGKNFDGFMALELYEGSLRQVNGKLFEDPAFHVDKDGFEAFEKGFPFKEKYITDTQFK